MIFQVIVATILMLSWITEINSAPIPYGDLEDPFLISCNHSYNSPKTILNMGNNEVVDIPKMNSTYPIFKGYEVLKVWRGEPVVLMYGSEASEFSSSYLKNLKNRKFVPNVHDLLAGKVTCEEAKKNLSSYGCRGIHSECSDLSNGYGYGCNFLTGFEGNPYIFDGCQDIDECTSLEPCVGTCTNLLGSYSCSCPKGFQGDGKKDGSGCHPERFMVSAIASSWIFWRRKQERLSRLRRNLFKRNGGFILENMLSGEITLQLFTADDLRRATDNYNENRVLYRNEYREISYKGILPDAENQQVTIQKCYEFEGCDTSDILVFISKLVTLSRINHKNVVKFIGCCLETQVSLPVYESINNKTLYDYIHDDYGEGYFSWDVRLNIAAETAGILAYLHSITSQVPIIHGNLNSCSITLNHDYTVKLHDFGRGVVLAELLTGKKVITFERMEGEEDLCKYFMSLPGGDDLLRILDPRLVAEGKIEQLTQVAKVAQRCLSSSSAERPTMEEVVIALEYVISWNST
ncbi:Serine/threonine protein kinase [Handroanthus impetiginosus]|uniref:Serine/threonine protein kinase n=1 Tax=Handroanthus impetiginosus TaxID=429701 RepID=A0A2G9H549_9LAMI|nr:Serine/threonine protein kinase [Handroanthus impetiginosus]